MRAIWSSPVVWSVAGAEALVGVRPSRRYHRPLAVVHRTLQCRLEMPRVAILIERQGHHAPVVPGCRDEILRVEVRVAARVLHVCFACPACHRGCGDRIECLAAGAHDKFRDASVWIEIAVRVKRAVAGVEVVVSVQPQVGSGFVEQLPESLGGNAFWAYPVRGAERGLMPVGEGTRGVVLFEILLQPCKFGGKPGARGRTAARLRRALYAE